MSGRISARDIAWLDEALAAHRQKNSRRYRPEFFVPMIPPTATHQKKKWRVVNGKPVPYEPDEVKAARSKLMVAEKFWAEVPGIYISITELSEGTK